MAVHFFFSLSHFGLFVCLFVFNSVHLVEILRAVKKCGMPDALQESREKVHRLLMFLSWVVFSVRPEIKRRTRTIELMQMKSPKVLSCN